MPDSIVIRKSFQEAIPTLPWAQNNSVAEVQLLQTVNSGFSNDRGLGFIEWDPLHKHRGKLQCYTVFDLLSSCMSEAATVQGGYLRPFAFFEQLLSLFAHWCRTVRPSQDYRPKTVAIMNIRDTIVLGATIPDVPDIPGAKEHIRKTREILLEGKLPWEKRGTHTHLVCKEAKSMEGKQIYGHCAETPFFALLCMV